jgi:thiol-disulfide isomerase/thioredoxin
MTATPWLRAAALVALLGWFASAHAQVVGEPFPSFTLRDQHGALMTEADLVGRRWLVNVWASWCPPCEAEMPNLVRAAAEVHGLELLLFNTTETASVAGAWLAAQGYDVRTLVDPDQSERGLERMLSVLSRFRSRGIPTTYFVEADGTLRAVVRGEMTPEALAERLQVAFGLTWRP